MIAYPNRGTPFVIDIDSSLPRDVPETCRIKRNGGFPVRTGLLRHTAFPFTAAQEVAYRCNV